MSFANQIPEIHQTICGIVFFGAPHRGLDNPELESLLENKPPVTLLSQLRPESPLLIGLNQRFPSACKHIRIVSCYETHETPSPQLKDPSNPAAGWARTGLPRFLVPRTSACLDWGPESETRIAVHANHSTMAKLENTVGGAVHEIGREICRMVDAGAAVVALRRATYGWNDTCSDVQLVDQFAALQYEHSWLVSWAAAMSGVPPSRQDPGLSDLAAPGPVVPYGHPAYPIMAEAEHVLESLARILRKHAISSIEMETGGQDKGPAVSFPVPPAGEPQSSQQITLMGLSSQFQPILSTAGSVSEGTMLSKDSRKTTFGIGGWTADEKARFSILVNHLRQVNESLVRFNFAMKGETSHDIIASATLLSTLALQTRDAMPQQHLGALSNKHSRYQELSDRTSHQQRYHGPMQQEPTLFPLSSINSGAETSEMSNYRVISVFDDPISDLGPTSGTDTQIYPPMP